MPNYDITADVGTFILTGNNAQISYAGTYSLDSDSGDFALTGQEATLTYSERLSLTAETGEFNLNQSLTGFGSFVPTIPRTSLYVKRDDTYLSTQGYSVSIDILEGINYSRGITPEYSFIKNAYVENLNPDDDQSTEQLCQAAIDAVIELTGDIGASSPDVSTPTYIERIVSEMKGAHEGKVQVHYKSYKIKSYDISTALGSIETNRTYAGAPIFTKYTYPADYEIDSRKAGRSIEQGGLVSTPIGETTITVKFVITRGVMPTFIVNGVYVYTGGDRSASVILSALQLMTGKLNANTLTFGFISAPPRTILIDSVTGNSNDGGVSFDAAFTMKYKPTGHEQTATFINSDTGKPPPDLLGEIIQIPGGALLHRGFYVPQVIGTTTIPDFLFESPNFSVLGTDSFWAIT